MADNFSSKRPKMSISNRAKQFAPFSALRGLSAELSRVEKVVVAKPELSEYMTDKLNFAISSLKNGDMATVVYFADGEFIKITGMVARVDMDLRVLRIVNTGISFDDIYSIECEK